MTYTIACSTSWNCLRHEQGADMVAELRGLGFSTIELNFQCSPAKVAQVKACVQAGNIAVSSVHNYCPIPDAVAPEKANPDVPSLAAHDDRVRTEAVRLTKRSIETAASLQARAVVLHCGRVEIESRTRKLIQLAREQGLESKAFVRMRDEAIDDRRTHARIHSEALATSISELVGCARDQGIILGLENRFYYRELPSPDEIEKLLKYFPDRTIGYWHDIGHAYILEHLGFYPRHSYLQRFHKKMVGMHLHDIIDLQDHYAPFQGEYPWRDLTYFSCGSAIKVIEAQQCVTPRELQDAAVRLEKDVFDA